ncbi:hypothetical protein BDV36DRAFT_277273 [Aspergillus pseudocaelatus]|uniref:Uncharacterized protein n=1 Tax=Aspergillus pseudocaelatus TaxID=1825620 RepID=A0ABQ6W5F4_9EURO|nr:hypothetical protein BDV36DRAFT_277273 [Aspergillus pseudocaelatus]
MRSIWTCISLMAFNYTCSHVVLAFACGYKGAGGKYCLGFWKDAYMGDRRSIDLE